jgi:prepilin-type N-terminal cleavage/methylation domain-containing protein
MSKKGFTLIELLVVVFIIGILAAIALPQYQLATLKAKISQSLPILKAIGNAQDEYFLIRSDYADDFNLLSVKIGSQCAAKSCTVNNIQYDIQPDGNIVAFYSQPTSSALSVMYRYSSAVSVYGGLIKGDFVCIPRGNALYIKACKAMAGNNPKTVSGFTGGNGYAWR